MLRRLLPALALALLPATARANDVFIAPTTQGTGAGTSCLNAFAATAFNTLVNWTSGTPTGTQIGPGTTVHPCPGTYTFPGTTSGLIFQGNGNSGGQVTLSADQGAVTITAPAWHSTTSGVDTAGHSFVSILGNGNLTIQASANGSALANQIDGGNGVLFKGGSNVTIKGVLASNIYVHVQCVAPYTGCDEGAQSTGGFSGWGSNIDFENNTCHDAKICFGFNTPGGTSFSNYLFAHNEGYNCDHGLEFGAGGDNSTVTGVLLIGNHMHDFINWDDNPAVNNNHHDGFHDFTGDHANDLYVNFTYINNVVDGNFGAGYNSSYFIEGLTTQTGLVYINDISNDQSSIGHSGCGAFCLENNNVKVYNSDALYANPSLASGTAFNFYGTNITLLNSIAVGAHEAVAIETGASVLQANFNTYYQIGSSGWNQGSFAGWQSGGNDLQGQNGLNPLLNASYVPQAGSSVIGKATNLTSTCSGQPVPGLGSLCFDAAGRTRPATGNWDTGAFNFVTTSAPSAPTSLTASASGSSANLAWTGSSGNPVPTAYSLYRGTVHNGPYSVVKSGITGLSTTDTPASGTYFYVTTAYVGGVVSSITGNGSTATVTCTATCTFPSGTVFVIGGNSQAAFNGTFTSTGQPTGSTFTFASATSATGTGGGVWVSTSESGKSNEAQVTLPATLTVSFAPTALTFTSTVVGSPSATQNVAVTNTSGAGNTVTISSVSFIGSNPADFSQTNNCTSLAPGAQCTVTAKFTPTASGARTANLTFVDNATGSPQTVLVSGTGVAQAPAVTLTPASLTFPQQLLSTPSATQPIVLQNSGTGTLSISSIAASGDFSQSNTCGATLGAGLTCTITVTFTPTAVGLRTGAITVTDNAAGSPHTAALSGTGIQARCTLTGTTVLTGITIVCHP